MKFMKLQLPEVKPYREFYEVLQVDLTDKELTEQAKELARKQHELDREEEDKKRITNEFSGRIKSIKATLSRIAYIVDSGYELREVRAGLYLDYPAKGKKTVIRLDTGALVKTEEMTDADRQLALPINPEVPPAN